MFIIRKILKLLLRIVIFILVITIGITLVFRWVPVPGTPLMIIRLFDQYKEGNGLRLKHDWVPLSEISPYLQLAVVCAEDQNYLKHVGFDWKAMKKAMKSNEKGRKLRGGSTISQQTAKNVFLWPGRSYLRKGLEAYFTLLIEMLWTKERILEVYLNSIEMGDGIYGAEAAARHWFRKPAASLGRDECAAIAAILPNPRKYKANPANPYIVKRKNWIRQQMEFHGNRLELDPEENEKKTISKKKK